MFFETSVVQTSMIVNKELSLLHKAGITRVKSCMKLRRTIYWYQFTFSVGDVGCIIYSIRSLRVQHCTKSKIRLVDIDIK
jgi:hypothetical protein